MDGTGLTIKQLQAILIQAAYGRAMLAVHHIEMKLVTYLMCYAVENSYSSDNDAIKRMPLGTLVREFVTKFVPSGQIEEELDNMVYFRNELAHRISQTIFHHAAHDDWQQRVIEELATIEGYFHETDELLTPYMERSYGAIKITESDIYRVAQQIYPGLKIVD